MARTMVATLPFTLLLRSAMAVSTAEASRAGSASESVAQAWRAAAEAIPNWKLNMMLDPTKLIPPANPSETYGSALQTPFETVVDGGYGYAGLYSDGTRVGYGGGDHSGVTGAIYAPGSGGGAYGGQSMIAEKRTISETTFGSTAAQDEQKCPIVRLPDYMVLSAAQSGSSGSSGKWQTGQSVSIGSWTQNFWGRNWQSIYLKTIDGQLGAKASPRSEQELYDMYSWKASAKNYPTLQKLDTQNLVTSSGTVANLSSVDTLAYALTDCADNLMFVVHLQMRSPGTIDVYDRNGKLVAHSVSDPLIARHQFVDSNGYLLAISESPGILMNVTRPDLPGPGKKTNLAPYAILFSEGGYEGASGLLSTDFHWVLAAAIQVRAAVDAYGTWIPEMAMSAMLWTVGFIVLWLLVLGCAMFSLFRIVYPDVSDDEMRNNPFIYSTRKMYYT